MTETMLPLADYADRAAKSLRSVQRWLEAGELPGAQQDGDGRWWVPAGAVRVAAPAMEKRARRQAAKASSYDVVPAGVPPAATSHDVVPAGPAIGHGGSLDEFAGLMGFSPRGVRRLYADMQASPGLPLYVGRYRPHGAMAVYVAPR